MHATIDPTDRALLLTAALTAMRWGRAARTALARQRLARPAACGCAATMTAATGAPKDSRGSRAVPLADRLAVALERHFQRSAYRPTTTSSSVIRRSAPCSTTRTLWRRFKRALRAAGVREVRFHDLRHTFGTRMAAAGVPLRTLQEWLGPRLHDHACLRRLSAERGGGGARRARLRSWNRSGAYLGARSERNCFEPR
jgi:integrase